MATVNNYTLTSDCSLHACLYWCTGMTGTYCRLQLRPLTLGWILAIVQFKQVTFFMDSLASVFALLWHA